MCMGSLKKFMNETKPEKSYHGYYLEVENDNLCLLYERQRQDSLKQARTTLTKADHTFKLLVIDISALAFQLMCTTWFISHIGYWYICICILVAFAFRHTLCIWRSFTALVLAGDMRDSGVCYSVQASHQQCKIIWKYSKGPKVQLELPAKAVGWVCSRLLCALELGRADHLP